MHSLTNRAGQQCCYDDRGGLIIGSPGGGSVDRVSQELSRVEHFLEDIYPFVICCKGRFSDCTKYYERRPSHDGSNFVPPPPPGTYMPQLEYRISTIKHRGYSSRDLLWLLFEGGH